jgi:hypothetical protein
LLCEFLPPKTTINSDEYCRTLERLCEAIKWKRLGSLIAGVRFLHDWARSHTSAQTVAWLQKQQWEILLQHPQHSPDLTTFDFCPFTPFNFHQEKDLKTNTHCKNSSTNFTSLGKEHWNTAM